MQDIEDKITKINNVVKRISYYIKEIEENDELMLMNECNIDCQSEGKLLRLPTNIRVVNEDEDDDKKE